MKHPREHPLIPNYDWANETDADRLRDVLRRVRNAKACAQQEAQALSGPLLAEWRLHTKDLEAWERIMSGRLTELA